VRPAIALLTCAALLVSPACMVNHGCTTIGCGFSTQLMGNVSVPWQRLQSSIINVCRNDVCVAGRFSSITEQPPENVGLGFSLSNVADALEPTATVTVFTRTGGKFDIMVTWPNVTNAKDGDTYRVTLTDAASTALLSLSEKAVYQVSQPNGPDCAPVCRTFNVDRRTL